MTEPIRSTVPTVIEPVISGDTLETLLAEWRVLPKGYRVVITREPSMLMRGKIGEMVTVYYGRDILTRHLRHV